MKGIYLTYNSPVKTGEALCIKLRINNKYGFISEVKALFNLYGQEPGKEDIVDLAYDKASSDNEYSTFKAIKFFDTPNYHTFYIAVKLNGVWQNIKYSGEEDSAVLESEAEGKNLEFWKCFSYLKTFKTPDWVKGGIMYQIFVDTFCCKDPPESVKDKLVAWNTFPKWMPDSDGVYRNDQYYGGNIKGIISKIPYIKSLGVTAIYLTPIFKGGSSNRYDTIDYEEIDETRYYFLKIPYQIIKELHQKDFKKFRQPRSKNDINALDESIGFSFNRTPVVHSNITVSEDKVIVTISKFSSEEPRSGKTEVEKLWKKWWRT